MTDLFAYINGSTQNTTVQQADFSESYIGGSSRNYGYDFYFKVDEEKMLFPITPGELTITIGSRNETVTLINEGEVNILKSPALVDIEFEARFPMVAYPFSREPESFQTYWDFLKSLKENRQSFRFIVIRNTLRNQKSWATDFLVSLEELELNESADEGDDVIVKIKLKQYKPYGVRFLNKKEDKPTTTSSSETPRESEKKVTDTSYTVKSGDCLWLISKNFYGNGSEWTTIYNANKTVIENTAKKYGKKSSSNGHWIYPGTKLTIPAKK